MRRLLLLALLTVGSTFAQYIPVSGWCQDGGVKIPIVGSLLSLSPVQASYPGCSVTVYLTGTTTKATIYNSSSVPITNPFTASITTGQWTFYIAAGIYDVYMSGGGSGGIPTPFTTSIGVGGSGTGGLPGGTGIVKVTSGVGGLATYTDVVGLWTSCSSGYLMYNGTCGAGGSSTWPTLGGGTNTSSAFVLGTGSSMSTTGGGTNVANMVDQVTSASACPTALGAFAYVNTLFGLCYGNSTNYNWIAYIGSASPVASGHFTQFGSATYQGFLQDNGYVASGAGKDLVTASTLGTSNNCAKWISTGDVGDAGAPCGTVTSFSAPSSDWPSFLVPQTITNPTTTPLLSVVAVTTGTGGKIVTAVNAGTINDCPVWDASGNLSAGVLCSLPAQTGNAGYIVSNGTTYSLGDLITGPSGALCAGTGCSGGTPGIIDIVTSVVPRLASANTFTGVNKFQQLQVTIYTVSTLPTCNGSFEGQFEGVSDSTSSPVYNATATGGGSTHIPVYCNGTNWTNH